VFCSYPAAAASGPDGDPASWLKKISEMKPGLVQISGGEPLLADLPDLIKVIVFCAGTGRVVELQTNGALIPGLSPVELTLLVKAVGAANGCFNINFPAHNSALDLKITRAKGAFYARTEAVKKLLALGAAVRLTHVVSSLNYKETAGFAAFAVKKFNSRAGVVSGPPAGGTGKGPLRVQFSFIKGIGRAENPRFIPEYRAAAPYLLKALELCGKKGLSCEVDHIPPCFLGPHHARSVDIAKMRAEVKGPHLTEKKKVPECRGCGFDRLCPGPRKDYISVHPLLFPFGKGDGI